MNEPKAWVYQAILVLSLVCFCLPIYGAQSGITNPVEVRALRQIRNALVDPNRNLSNWNRGDPCTSKWNGVLCFNRTLEDGYLHVKELQLLNMNLSGTLSPHLGLLSRLEIMDFMWNELTGNIPPQIGNIKPLVLLLLNGNNLTGPLPEQLGKLSNLDRIQIDQNMISGPIPKSFANLTMAKHFHMNNNSISGEIPPELSKLPNLVHFLLDNNNLSGRLPPEFSELPQLLILQVDNNHFDGSEIPQSYSNMSKLLKLSLRNCGLQGPIPNLSRIPNLGYLDLSKNQLNGTIPADKISDQITTIDLSNNNLTGTIPASFSGLPRLQKLSLANNSLTGSISSSIWGDRILNSTETLELKFQNNRFTNISGRSGNIPQNVSVWLQGNPICTSDPARVNQCRPERDDIRNGTTQGNSVLHCPTASCPFPFEYSRTSPVDCYCAAPLIVQYRLKSPGFSDFVPYVDEFKRYLSSGLALHEYQLDIVSFSWVKGPRLGMSLKLFPVFVVNSTHTFNDTEVRRIMGLFTGWNIGDSEVFGPYELLAFPLLGPYANVITSSPRNSGMSTGATVGIVLACVAAAATLSIIVTILVMKKRMKGNQLLAQKRRSSKTRVKIDGVKDFSFREMALATDNFASSAQVGQGGYGKVYRGVLADGTVVAIKRAQGGSLQGEREFLTEIELLSRLHHRNLVSLLGYCDEECEQMLVYEFMSNGSLRDHLSAKSKEPLSFALRLRIALGSAKGILYLHTEANPPIFHRDVKSSNILLDPRLTAKVADFGLSRLAPNPELEGNMPDHVSTVVKGTPGYLDPEYFLTRKLTDKSDVYSLGVVFLEILTGKHPIMHGKNIVREVNSSFQSGMIFSVVDNQMGPYPSDCIEKFATLALSCCKEETDSRPSMAEVVRQLDNIWLMMPESYTATSTDASFTPNSKASVTPPSSSSQMRNPFWSADVSGSNLDSGVIPTIVPR